MSYIVNENLIMRKKHNFRCQLTSILLFDQRINQPINKEIILLINAMYGIFTLSSWLEASPNYKRTALLARQLGANFPSIETEDRVDWITHSVAPFFQIAISR